MEESAVKFAHSASPVYTYMWFGKSEIRKNPRETLRWCSGEGSGKKRALLASITDQISSCQHFTRPL